MPRVLIADSLSPAAVEIFRQRGIDTDIKTGLSKDELIAVIGDYDGLVVRSDTKPNKDVIAAANVMSRMNGEQVVNAKVQVDHQLGGMPLEALINLLEKTST